MVPIAKHILNINNLSEYIGWRQLHQAKQKNVDYIIKKMYAMYIVSIKLYMFAITLMLMMLDVS